jgi:hypothetical protein
MLAGNIVFELHSGFMTQQGQALPGYFISLALVIPPLHLPKISSPAVRLFAKIAPAEAGQAHRAIFYAQPFATASRANELGCRYWV